MSDGFEVAAQYLEHVFADTRGGLPDMTDLARAKEIFLDALELAGFERRAFVEHACAGEADVRARVDALLAAEDRADAFLGVTADVPGYGNVSDWSGSSLLDAGLPGDLVLGDRIGPFLLEEELGVGGFGVVFRASQEQPVRRQVALKVIKLGMDTRSVMARFELERQALALMDHPNIAQVIDAGATDAGRPYFVMELVKGDPITRHCERHGLGLEARLRLFSTVCRAVQHAHQRGVLHRDLKPSNVLVAQVDGHDRPKVIDFGIAKATREDVIDVSLVTHEGFLLGTPDCMSPEQAEGAPDIDTRADVYSLGVLLYELLCGKAPFATVGRSLQDVLRDIREVDPKRPSLREGLAGFAVPQELDWVVMRCLEKQRDRRYATANELANEVERYLADEPLLAVPPSTWYRLSKLIQRHRGATAAVIGISVALIVGAIGTGIGLVRADRLNTQLTKSFEETKEANSQLDAALSETRAANAQLDLALVEARRQTEIAREVNAFLSRDLLGAARPTGLPNQGPDMPIGRLIDVAALALDAASIPGGRFVDQPLVEASLRYTLGSTYDTLGSFELSVRHMRRCVELRREHLGPHDLATLEALSFLGATEMRLGAWSTAVANSRAAYDGLHDHYGMEHVDTLAAAARLATALRQDGKSDEAFALLQETMPIAREVLGEGAPVTTDLGAALAIQYSDRGRYPEAENLYQRVIDAQVGVLGPESPVVLNSKMNLAAMFAATGRFKEAMQLFLEAIEVQRRVEGDEHPNVLNTLFNIVACLRSMGQLDQAEKIVVSGVPTAERVFGPQHPKTLMWLTAQAGIFEQRGDFSAAEPVFRDVMQRYETTYGAEHPATLQAASNLASDVHRLGRTAEAHELFASVHRGWVVSQGEDSPQAIDAQLTLGACERLMEDYDAAATTLLAAHQSAERVFGADHATTWEAAAALSLIESLRDQPTAAEVWVERATRLVDVGTARAQQAWTGAVQQLALAFERAGETAAAQRWREVAEGAPVR